MTVLRFKTTKQSIHDGSQAQEVLGSGDHFMVAMPFPDGVGGHCIRPLDRNETTAAVRTKNEKQGSVLPTNLLQNFEGPALECVRFARDRDGGGKLMVVGSVLYRPSAAWIGVT